MYKVEFNIIDDYVLISVHQSNYSHLNNYYFFTDQIFTEEELIQRLEMCIRQKWISPNYAYTVLGEVLKNTTLINEQSEDIMEIAHYLDSLFPIKNDPRLEIDFLYIHKNVRVPYLQIINAHTKEIIFDEIVYEEDAHEALAVLIQEENVDPMNIDILNYYFSQKIKIIVRPTLN